MTSKTVLAAALIGVAAITGPAMAETTAKQGAFAEVPLSFLDAAKVAAANADGDILDMGISFAGGRPVYRAVMMNHTSSSVLLIAMDGTVYASEIRKGVDAQAFSDIQNVAESVFRDEMPLADAQPECAEAIEALKAIELGAGQ